MELSSDPEILISGGLGFIGSGLGLAQAAQITTALVAA